MDLQKYILLIIGVVLLLVGVGMLAYTNNELSKCDSLGGKVVQFLDSSKREGCAGMETLLIVSYIEMLVSAALIVVYVIKRKS